MNSVVEGKCGMLAEWYQRRNDRRPESPVHKSRVERAGTLELNGEYDPARGWWGSGNGWVCESVRVMAFQCTGESYFRLRGDLMAYPAWPGLSPVVPWKRRNVPTLQHPQRWNTGEAGKTPTP